MGKAKHTLSPGWIKSALLKIRVQPSTSHRLLRALSRRQGNTNVNCGAAI